MESDPIGLRGGVNTFGYVKANPVKFFDKLGLKFSCIAIRKNNDINKEWLIILNKRFVTCDYRCMSDNKTEVIEGKNVEIHFFDPENDDGTEGNCIGQQYIESYNDYKGIFIMLKNGFAAFDPRQSDSQELREWGEENCKCSK